VIADRDFFFAPGSDFHPNPSKTEWAIAWLRCNSGGQHEDVDEGESNIYEIVTNIYNTMMCQYCFDVVQVAKLVASLQRRALVSLSSRQLVVIGTTARS